MQFTALFSVILFMTNVITTVSADQCATFTPTTYSDSSFLMALHKTPLHSTIRGISGTLHNYIIKLLSPDAATTSLTTYDIGFNITVIDSDESVSGVLYPELSDNVTISNFISVYKAFLVPPVTGDYIFSLDDVSDGGAIYIFDKRAMYCCDDMDLASWLDETSNFCYVPQDDSYQTKSMTVHLEAGLGYVIAFAYTNHGGNAIFKPSMTLPSGEVVTNFEGYIHGSVEDSECGVRNAETTIYSAGTESYNTTYSTAVVTYQTVGDFVTQSYTDIETIYYIMTPPAPSSSVISSATSSVASSSVSSVSSSVPSSTGTFSGNQKSSISSSAQSSKDSTTTQNSSAITSDNIDGYSNVRKHSASSSSNVESESNSAKITSSATSGEPTNSISSSFTVSDSTKSTASAGEDSEQRTNSKKGSMITSTYTDANGSIITTVVPCTTADQTMTTSTYTDVHGVTRTVIVPCTTASTDSITTSTYTDVYGITRTTVVPCSSSVTSSVTGSNISTENKAQGSTQTIITVTTNIADNGEQYVSTITRTEVVAVTSTKSNLASSTIQMQASASATTASASVRVQDTSNTAGKIATGFFISFISLLFI